MAQSQLEPWRSVDADSDESVRLVAELRREITPLHPLNGQEVEAIARRKDCDDVLFKLNDGRFAVVHLTWTGKPETGPRWPSFTIVDCMDEFIE